MLKLYRGIPLKHFLQYAGLQLLLLYVEAMYVPYGCTNFITKLVLGFIVMIERRMVRLMSDDDDDDVAVHRHCSL